MHRPLLSRRQFAIGGACAAAGTGGLLLPFAAQAQAAAWPAKPITILVGFTAGGPTDTTTRVIGDFLSRKWGQPIIVDIRPGANGTVAAGMAAKAAPDGYTMVMATRSVTMNAALYSKLPYDPAKAFVPVAIAVEQANILAVSKAFPARTVPALLQKLRAEPGQHTYASSGNGSIPHLSAEMFQSLTGTRINHVPYKGAASLLVDLMAGRVDMSFCSLGTVMGQIKEGSVIPVAVASDRRSPLIPEVPTFAEAGVPGFNVDTWHGLLAPAGTPPEIVAKINAGVNEALADADVRQKLMQGGSGINPVTPAAYRQRYDEDLVKYGQLIRKMGLQLD